ncbi:hypothetical protein, variant [Fonticula alba]|nr:hypothetical protein, variant [Fonticula alba]KCV67417.1 hypothetical protein, variant [Fonticula alba]|eukprot:XP_009498183.1 hypothetical protein, variant [Fonticula alba]
MLEVRHLQPPELEAACFAVRLAVGDQSVSAGSQTVPFASVEAALMEAVVARGSLLRASDTFRLVIDLIELDVAVTELRRISPPRAGVSCGWVGPGSRVLLAAKADGRVDLLNAPVMVTLSAPEGARPESELHILYPDYQPAHNLDVLLASAEGPAGRALLAWQAASDLSGLYVRHGDRVFQVRLCPGAGPGGMGLRGGRRLLASMARRAHGRPVSLAVCRPPAPLAVVWLETSRDIEQVDRSWLLAELAGAPLRVGQIIRFTSPAYCVRVARLMDRDFGDVPYGTASDGPSDDRTLVYVQTPRGRPEAMPRLASITSGPGEEAVMLLEPVAGQVDHPPGTLLVSEPAFRRMAGLVGQDSGPVRLQYRGMVFDVRPSKGVARFAVETHPREFMLMDEPGPFTLSPAPWVPVAACMVVAFAAAPGEVAGAGRPSGDLLKGDFLATHAGGTMQLGRTLPFVSGGRRMVATVHRLTWPGTPDTERPVGLLGVGHPPRGVRARPPSGLETDIDMAVPGDPAPAGGAGMPAPGEGVCATRGQVRTDTEVEVLLERQSSDMADGAFCTPPDHGPGSGEGRGKSPGRPPGQPGRGWLLVSRPGRESDALGACLEVRASPLERFPPGRAAVSPEFYLRMREWLADGADAFLQWGDHVLLVYPDPDPRSPLTEGQITISRWDFGRMFALGPVFLAQATARPRQVSQIELHLLSPVPGWEGEEIDHSNLARAFLDQLDGSVLTVGQEVELAVSQGRLASRVARLVDVQLRPMPCGLLSHGETWASVYVSTVRHDVRVGNPPASILLRLPMLTEAVRLPVATNVSPIHTGPDGLQVTGDTLAALQGHFLDRDSPLFVDKTLEITALSNPRLGLRANHILVGVNVLRMINGTLRLTCIEPPELLTLSCEVTWTGWFGVPVPEQSMLEELLLQAVSGSNVLRAQQVYPGPPASSELLFTMSRLVGDDLAEWNLGTMVPGMTRITFTSLENSGMDLTPRPLEMSLLCAIGRMPHLRVEFTRTPTPLYPGILLPREVLQLARESVAAGSAGMMDPLPEVLFFVCRGRVFVARPSDTHDTPGVVRVCRDFESFLARDSGGILHLPFLFFPTHLSIVHMRVALLGAGGTTGGSDPDDEPVDVGLALRDLRRAMEAAFPDSSMAVLERRSFACPRGVIVFTPELLWDIHGQVVPCGIFCPGDTRVHFRLKGIILCPGGKPAE